MIELGPVRFGSACGFGCTTPDFWGALFGARSSAGPGLAVCPDGLPFETAADGVVVGLGTPIAARSESSISSAMTAVVSVDLVNDLTQRHHSNHVLLPLFSDLIESSSEDVK